MINGKLKNELSLQSNSHLLLQPPMKNNRLQTDKIALLSPKTKAGRAARKEAERLRNVVPMVLPAVHKNRMLLELTRHFKNSGIGYKWHNENELLTTGINFPPIIFMANSSDGYVSVRNYPVKNHFAFNFCVNNDCCVLIAKLLRHGMILPNHIPSTLL